MNEMLKPLASGPSSAADVALALRYREPAGATDKPWNDTIATLLAHRTVRAFTADPLPAGTLEMLVAAAQSAPSSSNGQAWSVVAVKDEARKAALSQVAGGQAHVRTAPLVLVWIADLARTDRTAAARGLTLEGPDFTETFLVASLDAAFAAQNALVAAESLGLGTCYIGALRNDPQKVAEILGLPPRCYGVFGLVVGWPDPERPAAVKPRLPQESVLHMETYSHAGEAEALARYDRHTLDFKREQKQDDMPWTDQTLARLATVAALKGRDALRQTLERLGFPMK